MSGIEVLGIAASVIQIADAGARLSSKLFVFTRKVKNADRSIQDISREIAATGAALRGLGEALEQDKYATLGSCHSFHQTTQIVADCWEAFTEINETIGGEKLVKGEDATNENVSNAIAKFKQPSLSFKQRFKFPFKEPQINMLRSKLESLKSSLMLMLQVLLLAEQVRNRPKAPVSEEQKDLIKTLVDEKNVRDLDFKRSCMAIEAVPSEKPELKTTETDDSSTLIGITPSETLVERPATPKPTCITTAEPTADCIARSIPTIQTHVSVPPHPPASEGSATSRLSLKWASSKSSIMSSSDTLGSLSADLTVPASLRIRDEEIQHHAMLVHNLLEEISDVQYRIDHGIRHRMHDGILKIHWDEWTPFASKHGHDHFHRVFEPHRHVARYWLDLHEGSRPAPMTAMPSKKKVMIHFKDALEREFDIPFEQCQQWSDMMNLINHMFENNYSLKGSVLSGKYDLRTEDRRIVLPRLWDATIEPGMTVVMEMQPLNYFLPPPPHASSLPPKSGHTLPSHTHQLNLPLELPPPPPPRSALHSFRSRRHSARASEAMKAKESSEDSDDGLFSIPLKPSATSVNKSVNRPTLGSWGRPSYFSLGQPSASSHPIAPLPKSEPSATAAPASVAMTPDMWAMKNVIDWLARNGYSSEWQAAFQNLRLDGNNFLQLGGPRSGTLSLHSQIYPEMQRLCLERRKSWDWEQVRTEGRRLRKLITAIAQNTDLGPGPGYKRRDDDSYELPALTNENGSMLPDEPDEMIQVRTTRPGPPPPTRQALYTARDVNLGPSSASTSVSGSPSRSQLSYPELIETAFHVSDKSLDELDDSSQRVKPDAIEVLDQSQVDLLKDQIFAFKLLSKNGTLPAKLEEDLLSARLRQKSISNDEIDAMLGLTSVTPLLNTAQPRRDQPAQKSDLAAAAHVDDHTSQDYQMQLMQLEQQNKRRLVWAKEQGLVTPVRPLLPKSNVVLGAEAGNKGNRRSGAIDGQSTLQRVASKILQEDLRVAPRAETKQSTPDVMSSPLDFGSMQLTSPPRAADTPPYEMLSYNTQRLGDGSYAESRRTAFGDDYSNWRGHCFHPGCGRVFKDLEAHQLTHRAERPEKCPVSSCNYHEKGFARKYDKNRHALTHFDGTLVCGFCPGAATKAEKSFARVDVFKRHLANIHGVDHVPPHSRTIVRSNESAQRRVPCPSLSCNEWFLSAQAVYAHLDDCILKKVTTKVSEANTTEHKPEQHSVGAPVPRRTPSRRSQSADPLPQKNPSYAINGTRRLEAEAAIAAGGIDGAISLRADDMNPALAGLGPARAVNRPPSACGDSRKDLDSRSHHRSQSLDTYGRKSKIPQVLSAKFDSTKASDSGHGEENVTWSQPRRPDTSVGSVLETRKAEGSEAKFIPRVEKMSRSLLTKFARDADNDAASQGSRNPSSRLISKTESDDQELVGVPLRRTMYLDSGKPRVNDSASWNQLATSERGQADAPTTSTTSTVGIVQQTIPSKSQIPKREASLKRDTTSLTAMRRMSFDSADDLGSTSEERSQRWEDLVEAGVESDSSSGRAELQRKTEKLENHRALRESKARVRVADMMRWDDEKKAWVEESSTGAADPRTMIQPVFFGSHTVSTGGRDSSPGNFGDVDAEAGAALSATAPQYREETSRAGYPRRLYAHPNEDEGRRGEEDQDDDSDDEYMPFDTRALGGGFDGKMAYGAASDSAEEDKQPKRAVGHADSSHTRRIEAGTFRTGWSAVSGDEGNLSDLESSGEEDKGLEGRRNRYAAPTAEDEAAVEPRPELAVLELGTANDGDGVTGNEGKGAGNELLDLLATYTTLTVDEIAGVDTGGTGSQEQTQRRWF